MKAVEKFLDALVDESVMRDVIGPVLQLRFGGQLAVQEQIGSLEIGAFFGEVVDGIAAIAQDAGVAVDESDFADAGSGVVEGRIVAHHAEIGGFDFDLAQIGGADGVVARWELRSFCRCDCR